MMIPSVTLSIVIVGTCTIHVIWYTVYDEQFIDTNRRTKMTNIGFQLQLGKNFIIKNSLKYFKKIGINYVGI